MTRTHTHFTFESRLKKAFQIDKYSNRARLEPQRTLYRKLRDRSQQFMNGLPNMVGIETTRKCNLRCQYCPRFDLVNGKRLDISQDLSENTFGIILDECQWFSRSLRLIGFSGGLGEPLLDKQIYNRIELAKQAFPKARVALVTNGTLLTEQASRQLLQTGLDALTVSINFSNATAYTRYNGVNLYDTVKANITTFLKMKGPCKPDTSLQLLELDSDKATFEHEWKPKLNANDELKIHEMHGWTGTKPDYTKQFANRYPCSQLWERIHFTVEGDVYPCCMPPLCAELKLGRIHEQALKQMLKSPKLREIRLMHQHGIYPPSCVNCGVWHEKTTPLFKIGGVWI